LAALTAVLFGCGGAGAPSSGGGGATPTPTPTSTTPAPPSLAFSVLAAGPMIARVTFDTNGNGTLGDAGDAVAGTALDGRIGTGIESLAPQIASGTIPAAATVRIEASGIDTWSGLNFTQMRAPAGSTVVSPLTALIDAVGSEATVRSALRLDEGANALRGTVSLTTFDPVQGSISANADTAHNADRLTVLNLQLIALAKTLQDTTGDPVDYGATFLHATGYMAQQIAATGQLDLADAATIKALLQRSRYQFGTTSAQLDAMASLIARHNAALPLAPATSGAVRGWSWAFRFFVLPEFQLLYSGWPSRSDSRIAAITGQDIAAQAAAFRAMPEFLIAPYMAVPNYIELVAPGYSATMRGCASVPRLPSCDDRNFLTTVSADTRLSIISSSNDSAVTVAQNGTSLALSRVGTASPGLVTVIYSSQNDRGESAFGVLFVRVRLPD
jgi:hypothetical protein